MDKNLLIIIKDNFDQYHNLIKAITKKAFFCVKNIRFNELMSPRYLENIEKHKSENLYIALEKTLARQIEQRIIKIFKLIFNKPFNNIILIHTDINLVDKAALNNPEKNFFFFYSKRNIKLQASNFIIYINNLFQKSLQEMRLTDYIYNAFQEVVYAEILKKKNKKIKRLHEELKEKSKIDFLTNLYNRPAIFDFLDRERTRTIRDLWRLENSFKLGVNKKKAAPTIPYFNTQPLGEISDHFGVFSVMMIDLDNFKHINDSYGHLVGDKVLIKLGDLLLSKKILRSNDLAGRFGGEEFLIILPETNSKHALLPASRLAQHFKNITFKSEKGEFNTTLSIGISQYNINDKNNDNIIRRADKALYYAKEHGRDMIIIYEELLNQDLISKK